MYLLDPTAGEKRRRQIAARAENAYGSAKHVVDESLHAAMHQAHALKGRLSHEASGVQNSARGYAESLAAEAKHLSAELADRAASYLHAGQKQAEDYRRQGQAWGDSLSRDAASMYSSARDAGSGYHRDAVKASKPYVDRARQGGSYLSDIGQQLVDKAKDIGGKISGLAGSASDQAQQARKQAFRSVDQAKKAAKQGSSEARAWLSHNGPHEEGFGGGTVLSTALGFCAVGAGIMYFFDPEKGQRRRQWVIDQAEDCMSATGRIMHSAGSDIASQLRSLTGQAKEAATDAYTSVAGKKIDSGALLNRIRSEIGDAIPGAAGVQFMTESDGTVTVTGRIESTQIDYLLSALHRVPGVSHVINRIEVSQAAIVPEPAPATQQVGNL